MRLAAGRGQGAAVDVTDAFGSVAAQLARAAAELAAIRPELEFEDEPPPRRLAPHAAAMAATATHEDTELGMGRFVLLHDPAGQEAWAGQYRIIAYIRAELEPEIAADQLIGEVGWSWLTEALAARVTGYDNISGTVTTVVTEGFGTKRGEPVSTGFELRASWSPEVGPDGQPELGGHVAAWCDALCTAAGLPPLAPGVAVLKPPHRRPQP
jgi:Protein of unknown function (DUF3000)